MPLSITTRRTFVRRATYLAALGGRVASPAPGLNPDSLANFVDPVPIPELAKTIGLRPSPLDSSEKIPFYRVPNAAG
jgi:spore coat protein A, manganese oxidase